MKTKDKTARLSHKPSGNAKSIRKNTSNVPGTSSNLHKKNINMAGSSVPNGRSYATARIAQQEYIRLNKYIAEAGLVSRRKADELIASGAVKVNKKVVNELGTKVHLSDYITVNGDPIYVAHKYTYILLNKPKDCITSTIDEFGRKTVLDIVNISDRIFPVGRLDRNTTGVLLLTNDGELANKLTHPKYQINRTYNAKLDKILRAEDAQKIANGVDIGEGVITSPCEVLINPEVKTKVTITLAEGKNHEVRKIFESLGYEVKSLDRKYYHNLSTKGLERGKYRFLEKTEIDELRKIITLTGKASRSKQTTNRRHR